MTPEKIERMAKLANDFYEEVLPQAGRLVFQDYAAVNELGMLLGEFKREQEQPNND